MHNLAAKWPRFPDWSSSVLDRPGFVATSVSGLKQYVVSGDLDAFNTKSNLATPAVGALAIAGGDPYALRLARDRQLVVGPADMQVECGWIDGRFAVTDLSAGLHVFDVRGNSLDGLLERATTIDPNRPGASASIAFAGLNAIVYFREEAATLRVHVDRALAAYLWTWLESVECSR